MRIRTGGERRVEDDACPNEDLRSTSAGTPSAQSQEPSALSGRWLMCIIQSGRGRQKHGAGERSVGACGFCREGKSYKKRRGAGKSSHSFDSRTTIDTDHLALLGVCERTAQCVSSRPILSSR